jgi:hypothetical protein
MLRPGIDTTVDRECPIVPARETPNNVGVIDGSAVEA